MSIIASITYSELSRIIEQAYGQSVEFNTANNETVDISLTMLRNINVSISNISGNDVYLSYSAGIGTSLAISLLLRNMQDTIGHDALDNLSVGRIAIHLDKIKKLQAILKYVKPTSITFMPNGIEAEMETK